MSVLREVIRESIEAATMHALRRHREDEKRKSDVSKRPLPKPSKIMPDEGRQALFDVIKLVGPHQAKKMYGQMKNASPERIKDEFGNRIHSYRFSMNNRKNNLPNAKAAMAKAILFLGNTADETITRELERYLSDRISSDVNHQKSRMDSPWESGKMNYKT